MKVKKAVSGGGPGEYSTTLVAARWCTTRARVCICASRARFLGCHTYTMPYAGKRTVEYCMAGLHAATTRISPARTHTPSITCKACWGCG